MKEMKIVLEDGSFWSGTGHGGFASGEVVFTTASSGYPQAISDPSFAGQIIVFAFPMVGNYGVDECFLESGRPWARAVLAGAVEAGDYLGPRLEEWLAGYDIPLVTGVDTRSLVRHIRTKGALQGTVAPSGETPVFGMTSTHPVEEVSIKAPELMDGPGKTIAVIDYGLKQGIQRELLKRGCRVVRLPHNSSKEDILSWHPDGILLGNGPGDPSALVKETEVVSLLLKEVPIGGICLGLQIIALACGASTYKLPFGHRGENHAVIDLRSGRGLVTSQNHGYAVSESSLKGTGLEVTHRNLSDGSVEGVRSPGGEVLAIQYHPEGSPGPADGEVFFEEFLSMCERSSAR
ncbi:MAG TPA: carbamoyl phosphate synthase small subunit [Thermovirgaceae bacterium]|jgi:carbamoyl-phosphate synthase small subunit|nr:carbamoyl phosphate synthase small subunit [Thermovirgaceae bacterium]